MSVWNAVAGGDPAIHEIESAGGFNGASSMNRTWSASPTNPQIFTLSVWVKKSGLAFFQDILMAGTTGNFTLLTLNATDQIRIIHQVASSNVVDYITSSLFRDTSSWYHIVWTFNGAQSSGHNRLYINGIENQFWSTQIQPASTITPFINSANAVHYISRNSTSDIQQWNGYMADYHFIDGQIVFPGEFGEINDITGAWVPKKYTGTYGDDGFLLEFQNSGIPGEDSSGNGNTFTNSGVTQRGDTPTKNASTLNAHHKGANMTTTNAALVTTQTAAGAWRSHMTTLGVNTGKWYWENVPTVLPANNYFMAGIALEGWNGSSYIGFTTAGYGFYYTGTPDLRVYHNGVAIATFPIAGPLVINDVVMMAYDADLGRVWTGLNGTWVNSGDPAAGTGFVIDGIFVGHASYRIPGISLFDNTTQAIWRGDPEVFAFSAPTGFSPLVTTDLPAPEIDVPSEYFDVLTYAGDGVSPRDISGLDFSPDLVITKARTVVSGWWGTFDTERGATQTIWTNDDNQEFTAPGAGYLSAFNVDGFEVSAGVTNADTVNTSGATYVAYCWQQSITPGFDIVLYTGNGQDSQTVAHNLGAVPEMMIIKNRTSVVSWLVYHGYGVADPQTDYYVLNGTQAFTDSIAAWGDTAPTDSVFTVGNGSAVNEGSSNNVAYLFASVPGFSKFGSYVGNGSASGPFVYLGFRPKFIMIKNRTGVNSWVVLDSNRDHTPNQANPVNLYILPNLPQNETTAATILVDFYANGFRLRETAAAINANGNVYIYMAFAEHPFQYANAF